jgi:hypothetical protein
MDDLSRTGWIIGGATAVAVAGLVVGAFALRRREDFRGVWSEDTSKLKSKKTDEVTVIWKLPPGPPPVGTYEERRKEYAKYCRRGGGPKKWMRPLTPTTPPKDSGISKKDWVQDPWRKPENQPLSWWLQGGTCPGCSTVCGAECYAAKGQNYNDWAVRRRPWINLCDTVAGKGIPRIVEEDKNFRAKRVRFEETHEAEWDPPFGPDAKPVGRLPKDYWTNELVVNPAKVRRVFVRVHETGDFFDPEYAKQWLAHAREYVDKTYPRELERYLRGERKHAPVRIFWWAYTRSWRDPKIRPILRKFSKLRYPEIPERSGLKPKYRKAKDAFGILLSSDADTGVPWMKDERGRIIPVTYMLTRHDGIAHAAKRLDNRVPGIIFQDRDLRDEVIIGLKRFGAPICPAEGRKEALQHAINAVVAKYQLPSEREAVRTDKGVARHPEAREEILKIRKNKKIGCGDCKMCRPDSARKITDVTWNRFIRQAQEGVDSGVEAEFQLAKRSGDMTAYEHFMRGARKFQIAVKPVDDIAEEIRRTVEAGAAERAPERLEHLRKRAADEAQRIWSEKAALMPVVEG